MRRFPASQGRKNFGAELFLGPNSYFGQTWAVFFVFWGTRIGEKLPAGFTLLTFCGAQPPSWCITLAQNYDSVECLLA